MLCALHLVAPFVGAWIETIGIVLLVLKAILSRLSWARGLKLKVETQIAAFFAGRAFRGRVD